MDIFICLISMPLQILSSEMPAALGETCETPVSQPRGWLIHTVQTSLYCDMWQQFYNFGQKAAEIIKRENPFFSHLKRVGHSREGS